MSEPQDFQTEQDEDPRGQMSQACDPSMGRPRRKHFKSMTNLRQHHNQTLSRTEKQTNKKTTQTDRQRWLRGRFICSRYLQRGDRYTEMQTRAESVPQPTPAQGVGSWMPGWMK